MIGPLLIPTHADVSPEGSLPHEARYRRSCAFRSAADLPKRPSPVARLRRFLNSRIAAAIAHRERRSPCSRCTGPTSQLDNRRIYRGPIDDPSKERRGFASGGTEADLNKALPDDQHLKPRRSKCRLRYKPARMAARPPLASLASEAAHPLLRRRRLSHLPRHVSLRDRLRLAISRTKDNRYRCGVLAD